jgi:hypothetical protein
MREIAGKVNVACKRGDITLPSIFFKFFLDYFCLSPYCQREVSGKEADGADSELQ